MARVIEDFAADGIAVERMSARLLALAPGERHEVVAADETLCYDLGDESVVWLARGERYAFDGPRTLLVATAATA